MASSSSADRRSEPPPEAEIATICKALAHPVRVRMLRLLGAEGWYCGDLVGLFGLAQSTVSHHLKVLKEAGLIVGDEEGPSTCYRVDQERFRRFLRLVGEIGEPEQEA